MVYVDQEEDHYGPGPNFPPSRVFVSAGVVRRSNYKREWIGQDYIIIRGKFSGRYLSDVDSERWLLWALHQFEGQLEHNLYRALVDQFNSLFT